VPSCKALFKTYAESMLKCERKTPDDASTCYKLKQTLAGRKKVFAELCDDGKPPTLKAGKKAPDDFSCTGTAQSIFVLEPMVKECEK